MESSLWSKSLPSNRIKAIQELTKGQTLTNKLREMVVRPENNEFDSKSVDGVTIEIMEMFENTLSILSSSNLNDISYQPSNDIRYQNKWNIQKSKDESSKGIKTMTSWVILHWVLNLRCMKNSSTITKVTSTWTDDGYAWRKYCQKAIHNSKHQRSYFRCSNSLDQGCKATKQVQKSDDEPSLYKITYNGRHTCNNLQRVHQIIMEPSNPWDNVNLISFETTEFVKNNNGCNYVSSFKHTTKDTFPSLDRVKQIEVDSSDLQTSRVPIVGLTQVPQEPMSMTSPELGCDDMVLPTVFSSTHSKVIRDLCHFLFE